MDQIYKITKVGQEPPKSKVLPTPEKVKTAKNTRTFPKSSLKKTAKILPVRDPAKPPPLKKGSRRFTMRLNFNNKDRQEQVRKQVKKMSSQEIQDVLSKTTLSLNPKTPKKIIEETIVNAKLAGFVSS